LPPVEIFLLQFLKHLRTTYTDPIPSHSAPLEPQTLVPSDE